MSWYTSSKLWCFVGGVAAAGIGTLIAKAPKTREYAVSALAKGMEMQQTCNENIKSIKDDAADMAEEALQQSRADAAREDRRAEIEARIREQVEAELAAEEEAAQKEAEAEEAAAKKPAPKRATRSRKTTTRKTTK